MQFEIEAGPTPPRRVTILCWMLLLSRVCAKKLGHSCITPKNFTMPYRLSAISPPLSLPITASRNGVKGLYSKEGFIS